MHFLIFALERGLQFWRQLFLKWLNAGSHWWQNCLHLVDMMQNIIRCSEDFILWSIPFVVQGQYWPWPMRSLSKEGRSWKSKRSLGSGVFTKEVLTIQSNSNSNSNNNNNNNNNNKNKNKKTMTPSTPLGSRSFKTLLQSTRRWSRTPPRTTYPQIGPL